MAGQFVTCGLQDILVGEDLPCAVYLYLDFRFITYRAEGDKIDRSTYERLEMKQVKNLFIDEKDKAKFDAWRAKRELERRNSVPPLPEENKQFAKAREDAHRKLYDIFSSTHPEKIVTQTLDTSKQLVTEVMKFPFAVSTLAQLQGYSQGTVDHSVNVSVLSIYLAMQMGYTHQLILQHLGTGGLLHDLGKIKVKVLDTDKPAEITEKMKSHPAFGQEMLDAQSKIPNEVKLIIAQHHECHDGSGFPKKLRGSAIYDLARITAIANTFDELVADGTGPLVERQRNAINQLDQVLYPKFDPQKLEKALKILRMGV